MFDHIRMIARRLANPRPFNQLNEGTQVPRWWRTNNDEAGGGRTMMNLTGRMALAAALAVAIPMTAAAQQDPRAKHGAAPAAPRAAPARPAAPAARPAAPHAAPHIA